MQAAVFVHYIAGFRVGVTLNGSSGENECQAGLKPCGTEAT
jgi:hypothetical protein